MSTMSNNNCRKRPLECDGSSYNKENRGIASRASQAQDLKRRQIQQASWGFQEALTECGLVECVSENNDNDVANNPKTVTEVGCQIDASSTPSAIRSSLNALLEEMSRNGIDPKNERVLADLTEMIATNNDMTRKMLLPLYRVRTSNNQNCFSQFSQPEETNDGDDNGNEIIVESSSLVKILLRVDVLQTTLLTALVQKLPELATLDDEEDDKNVDVPRLIFSNMRWLDYIVDTSALTVTFAETLTFLASSSSSCQKTRQILLDAISTLPDILNDYNSLVVTNNDNGGEEEQANIVSTLQNIRVEDPSLLIPCLDAVGSLPLNESQFEDVTRDALEALANVERWALPALAAFLMNNCPQGNSSLADDVIEGIRKLPLGKSSCDDYDMNTSPSGGGSNDSEAVMIISLSRGFAHRSDLTSTLLKAIRETTPGDHLLADIWLLVCVSSANHYKSKVKAIFRHKANNGGFTTELLRQSLSGNGTALRDLFNISLCEMADGLLRSTDSAVCELGVTLYEILFEDFNDPMEQSDVVSSLVTHICAGVGVKEAEVDAAMRVFSSIIEKGGDGLRALRSFNALLLGMLEFLHHMTTSQLRRLFLLLFAAGDDEKDGASIELGNSSGMGSVCDDIQIVIEKNLSHGQIANKRIGIIGTVAYAVTRSSKLLQQQDAMEVEGTDATCMPGATASSPIVKDITEKIEKAYNKVKAVSNSMFDTNMSSENNIVANSNSNGSAAAFMLDELCHAVQGGRLVNEVRDWLSDKFQGEFEDLFVGDFEETEEEGQKGAKGSEGGGLDPKQIPTDVQDLAILNGTSDFGLPGELRFNIQDAESHVYVKILPVLSSLTRCNREILIQQCPMFRLMASLSDERFGGEGLSEIDAMLECPLLMPATESSGMEFEDLSATKQWAVTSSYFFATCWVRELVNNFVFAADPVSSTVPSTSQALTSSQGFDCRDVQQKLIERLKALISLEEELRFTSSKCFIFSPPGLDVLPAPKELYEVHSPNVDIPAYDPHASKKAAAAEKKILIKRAKEKEKKKSKMLKAKLKHEELLSSRALKALRPLDPQVCCAIGFDGLSAMQPSNEGSQCLSQIEVTSCGGPVISLLLNLLDKSLSDILTEKNCCVFNSAKEEWNDDNPYGTVSRSAKESNASSTAFISGGDSSKKCFDLLQRYINAGVFASLHEHLAIVAELRCGQNSADNDDETEKQLVATARCLFSCARTLFESEILTRTSTGKYFLNLILKQIGRGDRSGHQHSIRHPSTADMNNLLDNVSETVAEIITGAYTGDLEFAMDGVLTIESIFECSKRISDKSSDAEASSSSFGKKLSDVCDKLLKGHWPEETKMNKSNVGKLLSFFLEHSSDRMSCLARLVNDVLLEIPHTENCKGPVPLYPTCISSSFGSYYTVVMSYLWKELVNLFDWEDTNNPTYAKKIFLAMAKLINLLKSLFDLTSENDLSKKPILLQQLKVGSKFIETFVAKAIPFFQVHFQLHQDSILELIRRMQMNCRQMYDIISYGKREKDANLAKEAPRAKKVLEMFIHKVKSLLKKNNCMTAMWTKTLKTKCIDGSAMLDEDAGTQSDESEAGSEEAEEEEEGGGESEED